MKLALKDIEYILSNNSNKYRYCNMYHNDEFIYNIEFNNGNIMKIKDKENNIAEYIYDKSGIIISESIIYPDGEVESFYKLQNKGSILTEYMIINIPNDKYLSKALSTIRYEYGNIGNKYLKKYHLDGLKSIYTSGILYTVKCLDNGFEVYDDMVPVYKELYDNNDNLIYSYIIDYNCMQNTFIYNDNKISEQLVYSNRSLLYRIFYKYNEDNLLVQESIYYGDLIYFINYYYDSDGFIYKITSDSDSYNFKYNN